MILEIITVCSGLLFADCPKEFQVGAVGLPPGERFSSVNLTPEGGWLRPFCFRNRTNAGAYIRVIEWTNEAIRVEASKGVDVCIPRFLRKPTS